MAKHDEITRFSVNGKTFFFNRGVAKNDTEYLAINALWGKGQRERCVVFPAQMLDFHRAFVESMEEITNLSPTERRIVETCPDCGALPVDWRVVKNREGNLFAVFCRECRWIIFENVEDAHTKIKEEEDE